MKRQHLPALPPEALVAYELEPGNVLFVHPLQQRTIAGLTEAEQAVVALLLDGHDNASIAATRDRAVRTIANQVARIFRKLGVSSRAELAAKLSSK